MSRASGCICIAWRSAGIDHFMGFFVNIVSLLLPLTWPDSGHHGRGALPV